jgi:membrane protease YdiL (CAAX protease family)
MSPTTESPSTDRDAVLRDALWGAGGMLLALTAIKHLARALPGYETWLYTGLFALQLYVPLVRIGKNGVTEATLGLRLDGWARDLRDVAVAAALTGPAYALVVHALLRARGETFDLALPGGFLERLAVDIFVVALAEELFFRGFLQERLSRLLPARRRLFGAPFGAAVVLGSAVFALAHFVGDYRPARLATFFPSLLFGLLYARRQSLVAPVAYHAFCNFLQDALVASHQP